jgi:hypothetical protein
MFAVRLGGFSVFWATFWRSFLAQTLPSLQETNNSSCLGDLGQDQLLSGTSQVGLFSPIFWFPPEQPLCDPWHLQVPARSAAGSEASERPAVALLEGATPVIIDWEAFDADLDASIAASRSSTKYHGLTQKVRAQVKAYLAKQAALMIECH